jgi:hypothetical protein
MTWQLYWGDVHNHCGISYGQGSLENALAAARLHLDFCSVTGHASWHDMPHRTKGFEFVVDYHKDGFTKLAKHWDMVRQVIEAANLPHEFATFHGYEAHSSEFGDYHILSPSSDLSLLETKSPSDLVARLAPRPVIAIPHHIAYVPGYRAIKWQAFSTAISPVVEVYSKHGCSMSDQSPHAYLATLGPRDSRNTVRAGMCFGYRFGFVASTDHHGGYPGSYGDGLMAVLADEKTRQAIWDAILARRTYAVTGDRIACRFRVNGAEMGSEVSAHGTRQIELETAACDQLDRILIYKNSRPWKVLGIDALIPPAKSGKFKVRIETGWGRSLTGFQWNGEVRVRDGAIRSVETCLRGKSIFEPTQGGLDDANVNALDNRVIENTASYVTWQCTTFKNPSTIDSQTSAVILEIEGDTHSILDIQLNGKVMTLSICDLLTGGQGAHLQDFPSEAFLVHRAVPESQYRFKGQWSDAERETPCDTYDVEVRQTNEQYAWLSPIFVLS